MRNRILELVLVLLFIGTQFLDTEKMVAHGQTPLLLLNGTNLTVVPWGAPTKPWQKANATYPTIGEECNFWLDIELTTAPWPKGCWKYQYTDPCNQYEISYDGKSIDSCNLGNKTSCPEKGQTVEPQCIEYYKNKTFAKEEGGVKYRFPETG